jgi:hypothetical protein
MGDSGPRSLHCVVGAILLLAVVTTGVVSGDSRDRVVTYLTGNGEWRIFDPAHRKDELFMSGRPGAVYWDSTETHAEYIASGTLFRIQWEMGAQPWPVLQLPSSPGLSDWWFNPDSSCWQASAGGGVLRRPAKDGAPYGWCHSELWQSDRKGDTWRIIQTDTTDCGGCYFCETWKIPNPRAIRRNSALGFERLQSAMTIDGWGGTPVAIPPPAGEPPSRFKWYFIPFRTVPGRGLALRIVQRTPYPKVFLAPLYLVDRTRGTQRLLETPYFRRDEEMSRTGMAENDGFLLVSGYRTYVYDLSTGDQILDPPGYGDRPAVWIKRPAPARIDTLGLRRLRERFR